jgi:L-fuculose-phosphate aldolase
MSKNTAYTDIERARRAISNYGIELLEKDLTEGTGGNISARVDENRIAISPSGIPYEEITPEDVPSITLSGDQIEDSPEPSSESQMHAMVYEERDDVGGVVHTHSPYATTFASLNEPIPASHYLVAFVGNKIPVADYASYGTEELGRLAVDAMGSEYNACLLANHGVLTAGSSVEEAFDIALMVEYCARIHFQARSIGDPVIISDEEIENLEERFKGYGQGQ